MCVCYCVESFAHIECYSDRSRRGRHLVDPFVTVLFTVEWCVLYPCCVGVLVCVLLCKEEGSSPVSLQLLRGEI